MTLEEIQDYIGPDYVASYYAQECVFDISRLEDLSNYNLERIFFVRVHKDASKDDIDSQISELNKGA